MKKIAFLFAFIIIFATFAGCLGDDDETINERPIAEIKVDNLKISSGKYYTSVNVPVRFNGTLSTDLDGEIKSYLWNFDDGGLAYEVETSHIFLEEGEFTVILTVKDKVGSSDSDMVMVTVVGEASFDVDVNLASDMHRSSPGRTTDFVATITNTGNTEDTFTFTEGVLPSGWTFNCEYDEITLLPGETKMNIFSYKVSVTASKVKTEVSFFVGSKTDLALNIERSMIVDVKNPGAGPTQYGDLVQCQYIGWFVDGEVFDSSLEDFSEGRGDIPLKVSLGSGTAGEYMSVIPGFSSALMGMMAGEVNIVRLTPEEGYNDGEYRIFYVELVSIDT